MLKNRKNSDWKSPPYILQIHPKNLVNLHTRTHMLDLQTREHTHLSYSHWQKVELGERHDPEGFQSWKLVQWERRELLTPSTGKLRNDAITNNGWAAWGLLKVIDLARSSDLCCTCRPTHSCSMDWIQMSSVSCVGMFCCVGQAWPPLHHCSWTLYAQMRSLTWGKTTEPVSTLVTNPPLFDFLACIIDWD